VKNLPAVASNNWSESVPERLCEILKVDLQRKRPNHKNLKMLTMRSQLVLPIVDKSLV
jgi:hypothetical protein